LPEEGVGSIAPGSNTPSDEPSVGEAKCLDTWILLCLALTTHAKEARAGSYVFYAPLRRHLLQRHCLQVVQRYVEVPNTYVQCIHQPWTVRGLGVAPNQ